MKKVIKKISTIAAMVIAMLSIFAFNPAFSANTDCTNMYTVYADEEVVEPDGVDTSTTGSTEGDQAFTKLVNFFATWLKRVGYLVAFVGGIMFALAIKNNDADQKQSGLLTMVAGFVVVALCAAKNAIFKI